jgi:hypothetical protein
LDILWEEIRGASAERNKGLDEEKSDWIQFLDLLIKMIEYFRLNQTEEWNKKNTI